MGALRPAAAQPFRQEWNALQALRGSHFAPYSQKPAPPAAGSLNDKRKMLNGPV